MSIFLQKMLVYVLLAAFVWILITIVIDPLVAGFDRDARVFWYFGAALFLTSFLSHSIDTLNDSSRGSGDSNQAKKFSAWAVARFYEGSIAGLVAFAKILAKS